MQTHSKAVVVLKNMRILLFILLCTSVAPHRYRDDKPNFFFVTRRDTKEAICIVPGFSNDPFPTFNLDKLQFPPDVGFKYWDWLGDWRMQNDTNLLQKDGHNKMLIAGDQLFHFVGRLNLGLPIFLLASNISMWITADENRPGLLLQLDHLNSKTNLKDTTFKYCDQNPQVEGANCTIVDYKNGTNHLNDGNRWAGFRIHIDDWRSTVEMCENSYGKNKPIVKWAWSTANISDPFKSQNYLKMFAKSHQRNAAVWTEGAYQKPHLADSKEMKRNYTKRSSGELCVWVFWKRGSFNETQKLMEVKNLASGRVEPATNIKDDEWSTLFQWNHLEVGKYEFTLRIGKRKPIIIDLCPASKIARTWTSIPKAITKCQFFVDESYEFTAWPSAPPDPKLKTKWTLKEWAHVCDRLGIGSNDAKVQIKFCNYEGCNFSKCPHLIQHEPSHLFDFPIRKITWSKRYDVDKGNYYAVVADVEIVTN